MGKTVIKEDMFPEIRKPRMRCSGNDMGSCIRPAWSGG